MSKRERPTGQALPAGLAVRLASFSISNLGQFATASTERNDAGNSAVKTSFSSSGKSGGAFRSISSNFDVNEGNGTLSFSVPIPTTKSRSDIGPSLALSYDSGRGNAYGFGWNIPIASISRKTAQQIPLYDNEPGTFVLSGEDDLVPCLAGPAVHEKQVDGWIVHRYLPRVVKAQQRIERWTNQTDASDKHWRVISSDNVTRIFGQTKDSRISSNDSGRLKIFSWLLCFCYDAYGNCMELKYKAEDLVGITDTDMPSWEQKRSDEIRSRQKYIKSIKYGNRKPNRDPETWAPLAEKQDYLFEVLFDYGEHAEISPTTKEDNPWSVRKDCFSNCNAGFEIRTYRLCRRVLMFHHFLEKTEVKSPWAALEKRDREDRLVSSVVLKYDETERGSFLTSVQHCGHTTNGPSSSSEVAVPAPAPAPLPAKSQSDFYTECLPALTFAYSNVPDPAELGLKTLETKNLTSIPSALSQLSDWVDLNGDGVPGILSKLADGTLTYQRNKSQLEDSDSGFFSDAETLPEQPSIRWENDNYFEDLNGNGRKDLVCLDENKRLHGFFERQGDRGWSDFSTFESISSEAQVSDAIARIDLTGDGLPDLLYVNEDDITWCQSLGSKGYGPKRCTRAGDAEFTLTGNNRTAVLFADMTGDGLDDIVSISNGSITYNSNLGHGSFGCEVRMGNSPFMDNDNEFAQTRVRLLDADGSGTTDLLYLLPGGGANLYYNLSGNSFSDGVYLQNVPPISTVSSVFTLDIFGNGTSCLCWAGPSSTQNGLALHYLDLMDSQKPNLLVNFRNNMGLESKVEYRPSTFYSLKDEADGKPWASKVPFPVQCVSKVTTVNEVAGSENVVTYKYHDGFYDGVEREFNGFGMVEKYSEENFTSVGGGFAVMPTLTRTFYCTADDTIASHQPSSPRKLSSYYSSEILPYDRSAACRAIKGVATRKEVYGPDGVTPYIVNESSFTIIQVQSASDICEFPVYQTTPREILSTALGKIEEYAKISHDIVLKTNEFGDVQSSAKICYPCKVELEHQPEFVNQEQSEMHLELTETDYTNAIDEDSDSFRTPLPWRTRKYRVDTEILDDGLLKVEELDQMLYDDTSPRSLAKSLIADHRVFYLDSDMTERLGRGLLEKYSVVDVAYDLAFEPEMVNGIIDKLKTAYPNVSNEQLESEGGYVNFRHDGCLWNQSPNYQFSLDGAELEAARANFYTPMKVIDQFGNEQTIEMDEYRLFSVKSTNALDQSVSALIDYERMQPVHTTDENWNVQEVKLDCFGNVIGCAMVGKGGESTDNLSSFDAMPGKELLTAFFNNPSEELAARLLGDASSRTLYALDRYEEFGSGHPPAIAEISRPESGKTTNLRISLAYLDGKGQTTQIVEYHGDQEGTWRFSGYDVTDATGQQIRSYMPFYSEDPSFVPVSNMQSTFGHSFFDSLGRSVGHVAPNHTWSKTVHHPWYTVEYGPGSTIEIEDPSIDPDIGSHFALVERDTYYPSWIETQLKGDKLACRAAELSKVYKNLRHYTFIDAAGQSICELQEANNVKMTMRYVYDAYGNKIETYNTLDRLIERRAFNFLGVCLEQSSIDAGQNWSFANCLGATMYSGNSRNFIFRKTYDQLHRTKEKFLSPQGQAEELHETYIYGEKAPAGATGNMLGKLWRIKDQSGVTTNDKYDIRGHCTATTIQFAASYKSRIDWKSPSSLDLLPTAHTAEFVYDNFGQLLVHTDVHGNKERKVYTRVGNVKRLESKLAGTANDQPWTSYVESATFTADHEPLDTKYGNGTSKNRVYEPLSRNLVRETTTRRDGTVLEDLCRTHDCLDSRVTTINAAQQDVYFRNCRIQPVSEYTYDVFGQLKTATGREQISGISSSPNSQIPANVGSGDGSQMCSYIETYEYGPLRNLRLLKHEPESDAKVAAWTREYRYEEPSLLNPSEFGNRLSSTAVGGATEKVEYDTDAGSMGCITKMPGFSVMRWDCNNMLQASSTQVVQNGTPEMTYYVYNHSGERVRKVTERAAAEADPVILKETFYIQGAEIFTKYSGDATVKSTRLTSAITAESTIALLETNSDFVSDILVRCQVSSNLELDHQGLLVSYEEFSPFGTCTFSLLERDVEASRKYRFAKYMRDEETGLFQCGLRYYAPWLGRWISPDPIGLDDGPNLYAYCSNDPINLHDPTGTNGDQKKKGFLIRVTKLFGGKNKAPPVVEKPLQQWEVDRAKRLEERRARLMRLLDPGTRLKPAALVAADRSIAQHKMALFAHTMAIETGLHKIEEHYKDLHKFTQDIHEGKHGNILANDRLRADGAKALDLFKQSGGTIVKDVADRQNHGDFVTEMGWRAMSMASSLQGGIIRQSRHEREGTDANPFTREQRENLDPEVKKASLHKLTVQEQIRKKVGNITEMQASLVRNANGAYNEMRAIAEESKERWEWHDRNQWRFPGVRYHR